MRRDYHRWFAQALGRDMELLTFGHAGQPFIVFPTSEAAFYEYEDRGMVEAIADKIEVGAMQLCCVSTVDAESFFARGIGPRDRVARYLAYERYLMTDVVSFVQHGSGWQTPATQRSCEPHLPGTHSSLHAPASQYWPAGQVTFRHGSALQAPMMQSWGGVQASSGSLQSRQRPLMQVFVPQSMFAHRSTQAPVFSSHFSPG